MKIQKRIQSKIPKISSPKIGVSLPSTNTDTVTNTNTNTGTNAQYEYSYKYKD